jgi:hypothetical protein
MLVHVSSSDSNSEMPMPKTAQSFPPIDTWISMSEGEQDAVIQSIENARRRRSWIVPALTLAIIAVGIASAWHYLL